MTSTAPNLGQKLAALLAEGRFEEAIPLMQDTCRRMPGNARAHYALGCALAKAGRPQAALDSFRTCIRLQPHEAEPRLALGGALLGLGDTEAGERAFREVLEVAPDHPRAHLALGDIALGRRSFDEAEAHYRAVLTRQPSSGEALRGLSQVAQGRGDFRAAIAHLERWLEKAPDSADALTAMGHALMARSTRGNQGTPADAEPWFRRALEQAPEHAEAMAGLAMTLEFAGRHEDALEQILPLVERGFLHASVAVVLANLCPKYHPCESALEYAEKTLRSSHHAKAALAQLHFVLGRILDRLGRHDEAFHHYSEGNRQAARTLYDAGAHAGWIGQIIDVFSPARMARLPRADNRDERPVFIVGMPRSGTSLVEQILASHPGVAAGGELMLMNGLVQQAQMLDPDEAPFPRFMERLPAERLDQMATAFLAHLDEIGGDCSRVTDKMPHNFYFLGLIEKAFPGARIIHCRRDPRDTCLSIFFQNFNEGHPYAHDLFTIGTHYHQYRRLMDHWRNVLSLPMLEISYEALVREPEATIRGLLEFCGLPWHDACLAFHESRRRVNTASYDQVRRPLYTRSVDRWRHYEAHLAPLLEGLERGY